MLFIIPVDTARKVTENLREVLPIISGALICRVLGKMEEEETFRVSKS